MEVFNMITKRNYLRKSILFACGSFLLISQMLQGGIGSSGFFLWRHGIEFKLGIGLNDVSGGDLNPFFEGLYDSYNTGSNYITPGTPFPKINSGHELNGEMVFSFHPRLSLGLGIGAFSSDNSFNYFLRSKTYDAINLHYDFRMKIRAIPLTLNLHFRYPVFDKLKIVAHSGIGYYLGTFKLLYSIEDKTQGIVHAYSANLSWVCHSRSFGFQGGIGLEYELFSRLSLYVKTTYNSVKLINFKGMYEMILEQGGSTEKSSLDDLRLWYYKTLGDYVMLGMANEYGPVPADYRTVRKAEIDLSGLSLRLGISLHLW